MADGHDRLDCQLDFLIAVDSLKSARRSNLLMDGSRFENAAEQSWHLALWVMVFADTVPDVDMGRAISMALLHALHEVAGQSDAGPDVLGSLPSDQRQDFQAQWRAASEGTCPEGRYLRALDLAQSLFQDLCNPDLSPVERDALQSNLETGRFAELKDIWPTIYDHADSLRTGRGGRADEDLIARLRFLTEADHLKSILRDTTLCDGSRSENSGEHSWHIALYALVLAEHADREVRIDRVLSMLVLHDLVEIDAGDAPIHGDHDPDLQAALEVAAADRIFGLLPTGLAGDFRKIWGEFEAAHSDDAVFAKSIDRVQPVISNLESGGGSWPKFKVTPAQLESRVGQKVQLGASAVWWALKPRIDAWFANRAYNSEPHRSPRQI